MPEKSYKKVQVFDNVKGEYKMKKRIMRVAILMALLAGMLTVSAEATSSWSTQDWARHFNPLYFDQCNKVGNVRWGAHRE